MPNIFINLFKLILILSILFVTTLLTNHFGNIYWADQLYDKSQNLISKSSYFDAYDTVTEAIRLNPMEPNYYRGRARILISNLIGQPAELKSEIKAEALKDMQTALKLNPNNLVTLRNLVPLYFFLAVDDLSTSAAPDNIDYRYLEITRQFYNYVKNISPNDAGVYTLLAKYEKRLSMWEEYNENVEKVKSLRPDLLEWNDAFR